MSSSQARVVVEAAVPSDVDAIAALGVRLVCKYHALDPDRFLSPVEPVAPGYEHFVAGLLADPDAVVVVARDRAGGRLVGYACGQLRERDWNVLRDATGWVHDLFVLEEARRNGIGRMLFSELSTRMARLGARRLTLHASCKDEESVGFFSAARMRPVVTEWMVELPETQQRRGVPPP